MSSMSGAQFVVSAVAASKNIVAFTHPPPTLPYPPVRYNANKPKYPKISFFCQFSCGNFRSILTSLVLVELK